MNIVILGAGQVGATLAEALVGETNNVTIVDSDNSRLMQLRERLDIGTVCGHGSHPDVLRAANCLDADMLIAVTNNDEANMIACQVAYTVFNTPTKIARIRSESFQAHQELFADEAIPIDVIIVPEQLVAESLIQLIAVPGARQVVDFADGLINIVILRVSKEAPANEANILKFSKQFDSEQVKTLTVFRNKNRIKIDAATTFQNGDEVILLATKQLLSDIVQQFQTDISPCRSVIIAGGGNIGFSLAKHLEKKYQVKIIDPGEERVSFLAQNLSNALVLRGDGSDSELLQDENISDTSLFCAVTNNDGINIMSSLLAKRLGAKKVIPLITRGSYTELISGSEIDAAISPQHITVSALLRHIRKGDIVQGYAIREGSIEIIELIVHGDAQTSAVIGKKIRDIKLPNDTAIIAVMRNEQLFLEIDEVMLEAEDHVIIILYNKVCISTVEKLFQVSATYI